MCIVPKAKGIDNERCHGQQQERNPRFVELDRSHAEVLRIEHNRAELRKIRRVLIVENSFASEMDKHFNDFIRHFTETNSKEDVRLLWVEFRNFKKTRRQKERETEREFGCITVANQILGAVYDSLEDLAQLDKMVIAGYQLIEIKGSYSKNLYQAIQTVAQVFMDGKLDSLTRRNNLLREIPGGVVMVEDIPQ